VRAIHLSRQAIGQFEPPEDSIIISIRDPGSEPVKVPENPRIRAVLRVEPFHDIDRAIPGIGVAEYTLFDRARADAIAWFVRAHPTVPLIVAHCEAGISRSAGVCAAIQEHYRIELGRTAFQTGIPNRLVYRLVLEALRASA
jgi:predicted protein tyrosine phosphatase